MCRYRQERGGPPSLPNQSDKELTGFKILIDYRLGTADGRESILPTDKIKVIACRPCYRAIDFFHRITRSAPFGLKVARGAEKYSDNFDRARSIQLHQ